MNTAIKISRVTFTDSGKPFTIEAHFSTKILEFMALNRLNKLPDGSILIAHGVSRKHPLQAMKIAKNEVLWREENEDITDFMWRALQKEEELKNEASN